MHRRGFLTGLVTSIGTGPTNIGAGLTNHTADSGKDVSAHADTSLPDSVALDTVSTGFEIPLDMAFAPDSDLIYVAQQTGLAYVLESGERRDDPFLDLTDDIEPGFENGLLGIALHPDFAENRRLFVRYSASPRDGTPSNFSHTFVLSEFTVTDDGRRVDRESERAILEIPEPGPHHNAGDIEFGPDGYLYVGVGDGGGGRGDEGKGAVEDWYGAVPGGNGQDVTQNLLGSVLRIDVDGQEGDKPYAIPDDNPLVGRVGLDEHYAWGFRNPWRMSFDGDDLYVGDVGRSSYEEVNLVEKGGNYGWNVREATHCHEADDCPDSTPDVVRGGEPLIDPIIEYPHPNVADAPVSGNSVIGGCVYRGDRLPAMKGAYIFSDLDAGGELFAATRPADDGLWPTQVVEVAGNGSKLRRVFSFNRADDGAIYVLGEGPDIGGLYRLVPSEE